jgi:UDP-3-O-[3-hydroxymyristoyl] glucosamine N-acyltransferase
VAAQSGVTKSIKEPHTIWQGTPAAPIKQYQLQQIELRKLLKNSALDRIEHLEKKVKG